MRRALVLTNEAARHPFRQYLLVADELKPMPNILARKQSDMAFFGTSYLVFFTIIMGMIL